MKQIAVLGLSRFGASVARSLTAMGVEVLGVDNDPERVADLAHDITHVVQADILDNDALDSLGLRNFDVVVLSVKDVEISSPQGSRRRPYRRAGDRGIPRQNPGTDRRGQGDHAGKRYGNPIGAQPVQQ